MVITSEVQLYEDEDFELSENYDWQRPHEITPTPNFNTASCTAVQGPEARDCWLVSAISALVANKSLLNHVVETNYDVTSNSYTGKVSFKFWKLGKRTSVVIDDRLPTNNGDLVFAQRSEGDDFLVPLIEKAYAKLTGGSYDVINTNGSSLAAMLAFTGGTSDVFYCSNLTRDRVLSLGGAHANGALMTCGTISGDEMVEDVLFDQHCYEVSGFDLDNFSLQLKNPHGSTACLDANNNDESELLKAKQKKVVWVDLDCVTKNFSTLRVCYPESIITKCYKLVYCSEFTLNRFNNNFYFHHLKIDLRCSNDTNTTKHKVIISLTTDLKMTRHNEKSRIGLKIYKGTLFKSKNLIDESHALGFPETTVRCHLSPEVHTILSIHEVPLNFSLHNDSNFFLRVFVRQ